jgi:hypothetical protein
MPVAPFRLTAVARCATLLASLPIGGIAAQSGAAPDARYRQLTTLFAEWRPFQRPRVVDGVPDYSAAAMARQRLALPVWQARLRAIDTTGWSIAQQVDWHLVRAEMHGLEFDHRVLRPWAENPAFYVSVFADQSDQPRREGPFVEGSVELWKYTRPLSAAAMQEITPGLARVAPLFAQARRNLVGNRADLWRYASNALTEQEEALAGLLAAHDSTSPFGTTVREARDATRAFATWVAERAKTRTGPSGIGEREYDWYLKHVQLVPLGYREVKAQLERELARSHAFLALEEQRNAALPELVPVASEAEHAARFPAAVEAYVKWMGARGILELRDWMVPALTARVGRFRAGPREFFTEVDYRDPMVMRTHGYHWIDMERIAREPSASPIRSAILLYNIFDTRTEGLATGWEEMMLQAGLFDASPRSRELIYVLLAQRAARALGELLMHGAQRPVTEAAAFAVANTPRGWLRSGGGLVWFEQHLYLQQPGYGISYVIGKIDLERTMARRRAQLGPAFRMDRFMAEVERAGLIPASLLRWEVTGELPADVQRVLSR